MSQTVAVLHYLQRHNEGITSLDACRGKVSDDSGEMLIITRLSDIVYKLRNDGYNITTIDEEYTNRNGSKSRYARYRLIPEKLEAKNEKAKIHFYE